MIALRHALLICISVTFFAQEQTINDEITMDSHTVFGRQSSDCRGRGVCSFTTDDIHKAQVNSTIVYTQNTLSLSIYRDRIATEDEVKIIGHALTQNTNLDSLTFTLLDDFTLTGIHQISSQPNSTPSIPKGDYPVVVSDSTFLLTFNLE